MSIPLKWGNNIQLAAIYKKILPWKPIKRILGTLKLIISRLIQISARLAYELEGLAALTVKQYLNN